MPNFGIISRNEIVNITESISLETASALFFPQSVVLINGPEWIGWTYTGASWTSPIFTNEYIDETYNSILTSNEEYFVDSTNSQVNLYLTNNPQVGDKIKIFDAKGHSSTNNIVIDPSGLKIDSQQSTHSITVNGSYLELTYTGLTIGWSTLGSDIKQYINNLNVLESTGA